MRKIPGGMPPTLDLYYTCCVLLAAPSLNSLLWPCFRSSYGSFAVYAVCPTT